MSYSWDKIDEGFELETFSYGPITQTDIVKYQGASGDFQPIHHDLDFVKKAGFDAPLVIGMLPAGVMTLKAVDAFGARNVRKTGVRWRGQSFPGDVLKISTRVVKKYDEGQEHRIDLEISGTNQDEQEVIQGWMTFVVE